MHQGPSNMMQLIASFQTLECDRFRPKTIVQTVKVGFHIIIIFVIYHVGIVSICLSVLVITWIIIHYTQKHVCRPQ
jgi:hypothetical protein